MTAFGGTRTTPPRRPESPFSSWSFVGVLLVALVLQLPTSFGRCGEPPLYQSMQLKGTPKSSYLPGEKIFYECKPGYYYSFNYVLKTFCEKNSTWFPVDEACYKKTCPQLGEPLNGEVVYVNGTTTFGSQAHYVCNEGYNLIGVDILYCNVSGNNVEWSDSPPQCEKILCQPPPQIANGEFTNSHKDTFEYNEEVTYRCKPSDGPDEYSLVGESKLVCSGRNQWSPDPPECKVVKCEYPALENGRLASGFGKKFQYKSEVTFECLEGFYLEGSSTIVCGADSTWEPKIPKCIKGFY
uniref:Membrane cofactor protein n=1 Tax=Myotis myotis TaxID=51298 RepID=A0A7J7SPX7_MYOMY|nr:CD46 molecule [Myotis myotis]